MLIESRPAALSKEQLHERLWPATFVSDATLTSLVAELRTALGENATSRALRADGPSVRLRFQGDRNGARVAPDTSRSTAVLDYLGIGASALDEGEHLLGRDRDVAVWLDSPTVSRHHARIRVVGETATIEDLGSKNGTYLHGEPLARPSTLTDGDELRLGSVPLKFRLLGISSSTQTQRS